MGMKGFAKPILTIKFLNNTFLYVAREAWSTHRDHVSFYIVIYVVCIIPVVTPLFIDQ